MKKEKKVFQILRELTFGSVCVWRGKKRFAQKEKRKKRREIWTVLGLEASDGFVTEGRVSLTYGLQFGRMVGPPACGWAPSSY